MMKKVLLMLAILFTILTFVGAGYVLKSGGNVNPGYTVVPMAIAVACLSSYRYFKSQRNDNEPTE